MSMLGPIAGVVVFGVVAVAGFATWRWRTYDDASHPYVGKDLVATKEIAVSAAKAVDFRHAPELEILGLGATFDRIDYGQSFAAQRGEAAHDAWTIPAGTRLPVRQVVLAKRFFTGDTRWIAVDYVSADGTRRVVFDEEMICPAQAPEEGESGATSSARCGYKIGLRIAP